MLIRRILAPLLLLLIAGLFAACAKEEEPGAPALPAGYVAAGTFLTGGQETADLNAKSLSVSSLPDGGAALAFEFVQGSRISGGTAESAGAGVPAYTAYTLASPSRLVLEFPLLAYWDYTHGLALDHPLLQSTFQANIAGDPTVRIYFQLNEPVLLSAQAEGDRLTLSLLPTAAAEEAQYYVTLNAYPAYLAGELSRELSLAPTLAADGSNLVLITPPLQDEAAAQSFIMTGQLLSPDIPAEQWEVVSLAPGELPAYRLDTAHAEAYSTPAIRLRDTEQTLPVLAPNALYLAPMPDGGHLLSRELETAASAAGEAATAYQQLWALTPEGETRLLLPFEFAGIEQAAFSPDGRKLAILERAQGGTHLYVFDTDTYELLNDLSEMGFGSNTSAFAWNSLGNIVYAITGTSGMQLHQFDYSIPDESQRHSIVDRNSIDEGGLGFFDGELYFCTGSMEEGAWIYRIKPEGGVRKPFRQGSAFALSSDNRYMAVLQSSETSAEQSLQLLDLAEGSETTITSEIYPYDMLWSTDCRTLYYIESRISGGQTELDSVDDPNAAESAEEPASADATDPDAAEEAGGTAAEAPADPYPYTLWAYAVASGTSEAIADLAAPDLFTTNDPNVLLLNRYEADETGTQLRACYRLLLDTLQAPAEEAVPSAEGESLYNQDTMRLMGADFSPCCVIGS